MDQNMIKIPAKANSAINLKVMLGHFATSHSHISQYVDMTTLKCRLNEATLAANVLAQKYSSSTYVDTIVCMDGCEVIGSFMAERLTQQGVMSINRHKTISVVTPEIHTNGQLIFRDNLQPMVTNKHIILLIASATTGKTIEQSLKCLEYYGGIVEGISAIFSASSTVAGYEVDSIFTADDLDNYQTYEVTECPMCAAKQKLDGIVNGYGYSRL
ncbi:MAG: phosphoribosyltransferase [Lachnospiraceae bacterium]|nr:phosphoribosyltransferase [Lachnospiraceae bacterium]